MSLTNKTIAGSYKDLLQLNNSGSGVSATFTHTVKDGNGTSTALQVGKRQVLVKPNTNTISSFAITDADNNEILKANTTDKIINAGATLTAVNTQIKEFGVFDMSPTADTHHPMIAMSTMYSSFAQAFLPTTDFGTGTDPATTYSLSSGASHITPLYWYVPIAITIDEVRVIASTDAADTLNFHLFSYAMATGTGADAGDLTDGTLLAHNGSSLTTGDDRITTTTLTIDSANTAADRVILAFVENVGDTNDITAQLTVKYHYQ